MEKISWAKRLGLKEYPERKPLTQKQKKIRKKKQKQQKKSRRANRHKR